MLVRSASEIAAVGKPGITVPPAGAPGSAVGARTCARNAAALRAVTGVQTCLLAGPVTHELPPPVYVKRLGTSGLPAEPNALWHPLQTRAKEAGRAGPLPPVATHAGAPVIRGFGVPELACDEAPPSSPAATAPEPPIVVVPLPPVGVAPVPATVPPEPPTVPPDSTPPVSPDPPPPPDPDIAWLPVPWPPDPALPQPAPAMAAAKTTGPTSTLRRERKAAPKDVWTEVSANLTLMALEGCPMGLLLTRQRCKLPPFSWDNFVFQITS